MCIMNDELKENILNVAKYLFSAFKLTVIKHEYGCFTMTSDTGNKLKKHKRLKMNAFQYRQEKPLCDFSAYVAFNNKATNGQTDIKYVKE